MDLLTGCMGEVVVDGALISLCSSGVVASSLSISLSLSLSTSLVSCSADGHVSVHSTTVPSAHPEDLVDTPYQENSSCCSSCRRDKKDLTCGASMRAYWASALGVAVAERQHFVQISVSAVVGLSSV